MEAFSKQKIKFIVLAQLDEKSYIEILTINAENRDVACHQAEIVNGYGAYMALDEIQARKILKGLKSSKK